MKNRMKFTSILLTLVLLLFTSCSSPDFSNNLIDMATSQLGISETQALGGAGALLIVARNVLGDEFESISKLIPGISSYHNIAKAVGNASESISSLNEVRPVFENLGLDAGMVDRFVPVLTNYVSAAGGNSAGELLAGALK